MKETWKMFSTVRGKECGSTTKSKKDIGVSAIDKKEKKNSSKQERWILLISKTHSLSCSQRKALGPQPVVGSVKWYSPSGAPFGLSVKNMDTHWSGNPLWPKEISAGARKAVYHDSPLQRLSQEPNATKNLHSSTLGGLVQCIYDTALQWESLKKGGSTCIDTEECPHGKLGLQKNVYIMISFKKSQTNRFPTYLCAQLHNWH